MANFESFKNIVFISFTEKTKWSPYIICCNTFPAVCVINFILYDICIKTKSSVVFYDLRGAKTMVQISTLSIIKNKILRACYNDDNSKNKSFIDV